jgi:hypothetical protein
MSFYLSKIIKLIHYRNLIYICQFGTDFQLLILIKLGEFFHQFYFSFPASFY